jgi:hypothetical protein
MKLGFPSWRQLFRASWMRLAVSEAIVMLLGALLLIALVTAVDLDRLGWAVLLRHS